MEAALEMQTPCPGFVDVAAHVAGRLGNTASAMPLEDIRQRRLPAGVGTPARARADNRRPARIS